MRGKLWQSVSLKSTPNSNPDSNPDSTPDSTPGKSLSQLIGESDLVSVYGSEEYVDMVREFQASGSFDKMSEIYMIFCVSDDMAEQLLAEEEDEDLRDALRTLLFNAEKVSRDYQSEKIILLLYHDEEFINKTLKAAGLEGDYVMNKNAAPDGHLEIFAFTKRTVRDRTYTYRYYSSANGYGRSKNPYGAKPATNSR